MFPVCFLAFWTHIHAQCWYIDIDSTLIPIFIAATHSHVSPSQGVHAADLIRRTLDAIGYEAYLQRTQPDWETRWENVQELVNFAAGVETQESLDAEDEENKTWDETEGDTDDLGAYPSENEDAVVIRASSVSASSSKASSKPTSANGSTSVGVSKRPGLGKPQDRPSSSQGQGVRAMKQGTLSNWRSASLSNSTPPAPVRPEPPAEDILDLTGSDDEGTVQKPDGVDIRTRKLLRQDG
jgi:hypothetical protein